MSTTAVGTVLTRGIESARAMSQESAPQPGAPDVWTLSHDGLIQSMQAAAADPASVSAEDSAQFARAHAAAMNMPAATANQIENSMTAQASALSESVGAVGEAQGTLQTVGATLAVLTGVEQMLSTVLSAIPFPALPAVRITDFDIGFPHAHAHPPNLIPPAPPVPLPSMGPVIPIPILSGASNTLINGMPAGRCGDMGLGVWCGGYFPMYEVFLGSSNVWIEGARAARMLVDITKHCTFTVPKPNDPPLGPMLGTTVSASPNVLIGGFPMPSLTAVAVGAAMKGAFRLAGKGAKAFSRVTAPLRRRMADALGLQSGFLRCKVLRAEPVNLITGEVTVQHRDYAIPGRIVLEWTRHYGSHRTRRGVCGYGWDTPADARLIFEDDGAVLFHDGRGGTKVFPYLPAQGAVSELIDGATLEAAHDRLRVRVKSDLTYSFTRPGAGHRESPVLKVEDRCGNFLEYVRDAGGLRGIVESAGRRIEVESSAGLIREMRLRPSEHERPRLLARYRYSEAAELIAVEDSLGHPYQFRYENRRLVQHTDRNGLSFYYDYDGEKQSARCHHSWGDGGLYDYHFAHDAPARRVAITDSLGARSTVQLNELNLPEWEIDPLGGITRYEYDECGRTSSVTDPDGHCTKYQYDARGNLIQLTLPDGKSLTTIFNDDNKPVVVTDGSGGQWQQQWDARGLLVESVTPAGQVSRYEYNRHGQPVALTNPRGARTELSFDPVGNLTGLRDACSHDTQFAYDIIGNLIHKIDALGRRTSYGYDANSRLTGVRLPSGATRRFDHDAEGNLIRYVDENGADTRLEYFGQGQLARRIQPDGHSVQYHYDTEERLIGVTNQRGETYRLTRDAAGRIVEEIDYWGQSRRYELSLAGHVRESTDPLGRKLAYVTDSLGRVLKKLIPDPRNAGRMLEESFAYDGSGNLLVAENRHMKIQRRFDANGRLLEEKQGEHFTVRSEYDALGNRTARQTQLTRGSRVTRHEVRFAYDAMDRAIEIAIDGQAPIRLERDALGQITTEQLSSGVRREIEYNADGYLTRRLLRVGAREAVDTRFTYDVGGNLVERRDSQIGVDRFLYDPMSRVVQHIDPAGTLHQLVPDPAGDLLRTRIHREGEWAREGSYEDAAYRFDRAGNLVSRRDARGELTLEWDADQRLIESRRDDVATTYGYDPFGRRVFKQTANQKTLFYWDGDALAAENTGEHSHEYVYYPERFEPVARLDTDTGEAASVYYYHNDPNGCPTRITDRQGAVKWAVTYSVWGKVTRQHACTTGNALRLQGQYFDEETGLHYNRHRYYDPHIGQFVSTDPLRLAAGENLFRFASNPFSWIDPQGLACNTWNEFQKHHKGKFKTPRDAAIEYRNLVLNQSPWPIHHTPGTRVMVPGEQFNMAMSPTQPSVHPGGFGTMDHVPDVDYVRNDLAVKQAWKPNVDRVVTYEVTQPLPIKEGPVGPQVDKAAGQYLKGGGSQLEMQVPQADRMKYLKVVSETPIS